MKSVALFLFLVPCALGKSQDTLKHRNEFNVSLTCQIPQVNRYFFSNPRGGGFSYARIFNNNYLRAGVDFNKQIPIGSYNSIKPENINSYFSVVQGSHIFSSSAFRIGGGTKIFGANNSIRIGVDLLGGSFREDIQITRAIYGVHDHELIAGIPFSSHETILTYKNHFAGISPNIQFIYSLTKYFSISGELDFDFVYYFYNGQDSYVSDAFFFIPSMYISFGFRI